MRMIDANALQEQYIAKMKEVVKSTTITDISLVSLEALSLLCGYTLIMGAPTIKAEPKHGSWIWDKENDKMYCSECGYETDNWGVHQESDPIEWQVPNYCENCGANMRGEARAFTDEELKTYQEVIDRKSITTSVNIMNVMDGEEND